MKLGIGTVQFGLDYGISNNLGQTGTEEAAAIVDLALANGIRCFDTAPFYGTSERVLGMTLPDDETIDVMTKVQAGIDVDGARRMFLDSLKNLRRPAVYALLAHRAEDFLEPGGAELLHAMRRLRDQGLARRIGVSVYDSDVLANVMKLFTPDVVQLPLNVLDQRVLRDGILWRLLEAGVEVHVRSIFLQGLLLLPPEAVPRQLDGAGAALAAFGAIAAAHGLAKATAAFSFLKSVNAPFTAIIGVNTADQLANNLRAFTEARADVDFASCAVTGRDLVDPRRWPAVR